MLDWQHDINREDANMETQVEQFYVEVVEYATEEVVKQLGPNSEWRANKIDDGMNINLNHERYFTRIVSESEKAAV